MYKVLIVDDEVLVRVGLKTTIKWQDIGFTVVAEASNGEQGYEQYMKLRPDVIITDIKMPKRDGLWLAEMIRKENHHAKILVLTCHDDFEYARKAIKFGVEDYILKSEIEDEELISIMKSVKTKLDEQSGSKQIHDKDINNRNDIKRSIFSNLVKSNFMIDGKLMERFSSIEFPTENTKFAFTAISIDDEKGLSVDPAMLKQTNQAVLNVVFDLLTERSIDYIYFYQSKKNIFCLSSQMLNADELKRMFLSARDSVKHYFDTTLSVVFSQVFEYLDGAANIYADFLDKEQIQFYRADKAYTVSGVDSIRFGEENVISLKKQHNKKLLEVVGQENLEAAISQLGDTIEHFKMHKVNPKTVKIFYSNLLGDLFNSYGSFFEISSEINRYENYHDLIENADSIQTIQQTLSEFIGKVIHEIGATRNNNPKDIINQAINFIQQHYDQKISLDDVAQKLNLSKHYLCSAFKKVTGENMSLYINKLRIEKAKSLLLESDGRIKEIYEEVGYSNQQYFSKVFKKITGITVMEYKEKRITGNK